MINELVGRTVYLAKQGGAPDHYIEKLYGYLRRGAGDRGFDEVVADRVARDLWSERHAAIRPEVVGWTAGSAKDLEPEPKTVAQKTADDEAEFSTIVDVETGLITRSKLGQPTAPSAKQSTRSKRRSTLSAPRAMPGRDRSPARRRATQASDDFTALLTRSVRARTA